tara:strand:- start:2393 stop:3499 length:1107 start_codon:yes stop_codon:yes gene_type:complete
MEFLGSFGAKPTFQRIATPRDTVDNIIMYGVDNLYPQFIESIFNLSPITKSAVNLMANFIRGDGFENGDIEVNERGETANDILWSISNDQALYNGYALHLNSSGLGSVKTVEHIPFEFVRLGLPDQKGRIRDVRVSNNWESSNEQALPSDKLNAVRYLLFNDADNGREALTSNRGMVLYSTPKKNEYALSSIDPIIETAQSDNELQKFELGNITNGFLSMSIFKYPSAGDSEEQEEEIRRRLNDFKGASHANSVLVVGVDEDSENNQNLIEQVPANNNDSLFINTTLNVKNRILQNFALPSGLMGMLPDGAVFTATQLADEYVYMNLRTKDTRNHIERQMEKLGLDLGKIIPNQFESSQMADNGVTTG